MASGAGTPTGGDDVSHPHFARTWTASRIVMDGRGAAAQRDALLSGLAGRVVEVGAGDGANFGRYPRTVTEVVALEPEPRLREQAAQAARRAPVRVSVRAGRAEALPLPDAIADAVVYSLVLCTVGDQAAALAEAARVLRPGGELRFFEHVHAERGVMRLLLAAADRSGVWPLAAGGCHPARDTERAIRDAGFEVAEVERFGFRPAPLGPRLPFIRGRALAPG